MSGARRLTIYEPFRSIFYAPQFVALYGGHFAGEGLDVEVRTAGGGTTTTGALIDGHAEIALGGIMRSLDVADRGGPLLPHFAQVNQRNGFFLLSRTPRPTFRWADVVGTTIVSFAEAPTPWQCMLTVLRRHGVDPASVRIERTRSLAEALAAFRDGHGDFFETGQPFTEQLIAEGAAHLVASMGDATGPVPFSSYMTTGRFLGEGRDVLLRFTRALSRPALDTPELMDPDCPLGEYRAYLEVASHRLDRRLQGAGELLLSEITRRAQLIERHVPDHRVGLRSGASLGLRRHLLAKQPERLSHHRSFRRRARSSRRSVSRCWSYNRSARRTY